MRATLGEGPVWSAHENCLWFVDIKQQRIHRFDPLTHATQSWLAPAQVGFVAPVVDQGFVVGLQTGVHRFDPGSGAFTLLATVEPTQPNNRLNDGYVDRKGRLWFGSMDDGERKQTGALYHMGGDAMPIKVDEPYCITNGPSMSPDGRTLYHTDTVKRVIHAFDVSENGTLSNKRLFVAIAEHEGYPDGSCVDAEGCLWTGLWGGWSLMRFSPHGERIAKLSVPCANVTKAAFGGDDLCTLFITTARKGLDEAALAKHPQSGGLFSVRVDTPGLAQNKFRLR